MLDSTIRDQFPQLASDLVYLDTAATALKPRCVADALYQFYTRDYGTVHRAIYPSAARSTESYEKVREQIREFLNADKASEIIFTKGTTEALNLIAYSFGDAFINAGDEIIISEMEHHANFVPWQQLCLRKKAHLKIIPADKNGELNLERFKELLTSRTKLVSIAHIANSTGLINPIEEIIEEAHAVGAAVVVDGAQSAAHFSVDVQKLDADFFVFSGHKAYGPTGIGVLYGKQRYLEEMPPFLFGGDMIKKVTAENTTFQEPPLKFEAGTPPIAQVIGLGRALEFLSEIGIEEISAHEMALCNEALKRFKQIEGFDLIGKGDKRAAIINFNIKGIHPLDLGTLLGAKNIALRTGHHCAQPALAHFNYEVSARISFGIYNTYADLDILFSALEEICLKLNLSAHC